jgi:hypothetical protein
MQVVSNRHLEPDPDAGFGHPFGDAFIVDVPELSR